MSEHIHAEPGPRKLSDIFTPVELASFRGRSNWRGAWAIAVNWAMVAFAFALAAHMPHPLTFLAAMVIIAGRQLGLAILQHEASHRTLFASRWLNDVAADWLCARPVWQHLPKYRVHHMRHHAETGTDLDPDISLHAGFPVSRGSLARKLLRDITGLTGIKATAALVLMDAGVFEWTVASSVTRIPQQGRRWYDYPITWLRNAGGMLLTNALLFGVLYALGHGWVYWAWVAAFLTFFPLFVRVRSIAEHGCVPRVPDMLRNTRTTRAGLLARLTVAPNHVNFHIEHHLAPGIPHYRLPEAHRILLKRGQIAPPPGYLEVLRLASTSERAA